MSHRGAVIINPKTVIGDNINIATGVTIGQTNRGEKQGCPVIGNRVWIGTNAVIVGKITIGDDVLIAPNSYVNVDIPSHSVVVGNPAKIMPRENATEGYINNIV
ncbi:serine O-acetyltransferase [Candidatus Gastranaerophilus sp. (ex Termes propinquus)]|nr:serine O-acetyltransferase [Candidatus Gastranaerophilus sp. (ex Termes propinquus)]